jgi:hypothetical protein
MKLIGKKGQKGIIGFFFSLPNFDLVINFRTFHSNIFGVKSVGDTFQIYSIKADKFIEIHNSCIICAIK